MRAMRAAEGIVHIDVAELGQRKREERIVLLFLVMTAVVFDERHSAFPQYRAYFILWFTDAITGKRDRLADHLLRPCVDRAQRIFVHPLFFWLGEMLYLNDLGAMLTQ